MPGQPTSRSTARWWTAAARLAAPLVPRRRVLVAPRSTVREAERPCQPGRQQGLSAGVSRSASAHSRSWTIWEHAGVHRANSVSVKSADGSEFVVRVRPRGERLYRTAADTGTALFVDNWGEFLHYTVFRRRWWVEAFPVPRPLLSRNRWAETVASENAARDRMPVLISAIESGGWVPGGGTPPSDAPTRIGS
jgi:hypothetical protein